MAKISRPAGVSLICILGLVGALLSILGGLGAIIGASLIETTGPLFSLAEYGLTSVSLALIGVGTMIIGIVLLVSMIWLWNMRKIGWTAVMILEGLSLVIALVTLDLISMIIPAIIIIYLWTKKKLFK